MDAAAALFAKQGYPETSVPDIVRAAGVSQGTFYQYFRHRREVLMALAEVAHQATVQRPPSGPSDISEVLRTEISWYLGECARNRVLTKIWHDAAVYDHEIAAIVRGARDARATEFAALIRATPTAQAVNADVAATAITAMIEEFAYRWFIDGDKAKHRAEDAKEAADTLCEIVLRALGQTAGARLAF